MMTLAQNQCDLNSWRQRQIDYCLAAGFRTRDGKIRLQECLGPRPGYPSGYFAGAREVTEAELSEMGIVEWRSDCLGDFVRIYSATKIDRYS